VKVKEKEKVKWCFSVMFGVLRRNAVFYGNKKSPGKSGALINLIYFRLNNVPCLPLLLEIHGRFRGATSH
jgi:hypothetical protein